ncbi:hypothetical protein FS749_005575 [Ceratobasidium sp. UAMH 11750]|nr:hypothetical protein FS749_005575 [Ceratobasidium sp. UAMH 11750]
MDPLSSPTSLISSAATESVVGVVGGEVDELDVDDEQTEPDIDELDEEAVDELESSRLAGQLDELDNWGNLTRLEYEPVQNTLDKLNYLAELDELDNDPRADEDEGYSRDQSCLTATNDNFASLVTAEESYSSSSASDNPPRKRLRPGCPVQHQRKVLEAVKNGTFVIKEASWAIFETKILKIDPHATFSREDPLHVPRSVCGNTYMLKDTYQPCTLNKRCKKYPPKQPAKPTVLKIRAELELSAKEMLYLVLV